MQENENAEASNIVAGTLLNSDNGRAFLDGSSRSDTTLRSAIVGLGTYHAGWKWSLHAGAQKGKSSENHIGYILKRSESFGIPIVLPIMPTRHLR